MSPAPGSITERMLWRKLFDRNPLFVTFADKLATQGVGRGALPRPRHTAHALAGDQTRPPSRRICCARAWC